MIQSQLKEEIEPPVADETLPLYDLIKQTTSKLSFYRKNLEQRWDEVEVMKQNEIDLCKGENQKPPKLKKIFTMNFHFRAKRANACDKLVQSIADYS